MATAGKIHLSQMPEISGFTLIQNIAKIRVRYSTKHSLSEKTSQELRMLSNVTLNCQVAKIVMNSGSQLSEL